MVRGLDRRTFLKSLGSAALAGAALDVLPLSLRAEGGDRPLRVALFFEHGFPSVEAAGADQAFLTHALQGYELTFLSAGELSARLPASTFDVLVLPFGSAFPAPAWEGLLGFLQRGGNLVNLGGAPLGVPAYPEGQGWRLGPPLLAYRRRLGITQVVPVATTTISSYTVAEDLEGIESLLRDFRAEHVYELTLRLANTKDFPDEDGSSGQRDAIVRPLLYGSGEDRIARVAPILAIDRMQGEFAGGRWVLAAMEGGLGERALRWIVEFAAQGASQFSLRPSVACYRNGEVPSFTVQWRRPRGTSLGLESGECQIHVHDAAGKLVGTLRESLQGRGLSSGSSAVMALRGRTLPPGFYKASAVLGIRSVGGGTLQLKALTGFWMMDERLLTSGRKLSCDGTYFQRGGEPYPVTGTTYMASDVHRKFLFEPNLALWDRDFRAMKAAGVNMVRTGIWTAWKKLMLDTGSPDEAALRSLDAFLLTAHRYDIPVIFTLFAFLPEAWGGENPFFDPRSLQAQKEFISTLVRRYAGVNDLIWDFINEPSFSSPNSLWSCRPNYDHFEKSAWKAWLRARDPGLSDAERDRRNQVRWRSRGDQPADLPQPEDFQDVNVLEDRRPFKALDYRLFAQQSFTGWAREMAREVRSAGGTHQLLTVGQDEGGTLDRPNPLWFAEAVDFTSNHTWWLNDDLAWDSVVAKRVGKPLLIEETGIMLYETLEGKATWTEEEKRNLLERKMAMALGINGAGFLQWIWNTNCYMPSDNEAAIGFFRSDGTAKPELQPMIEMARFMRRHRKLLRLRRQEDVVLFLPHSEMFSVREFASAATKRAVRSLLYGCGVRPRAVGEYAVGDLGLPALIVLPSPRVLRDEAWRAIRLAVEQGSTLLASGFFEADEYWYARARLGEVHEVGDPCPVAEEESLRVGDRELRLAYRGEKMHRIEKAASPDDRTPELTTLALGKGRVFWSPLPFELSDSADSTDEVYRFVLHEAGIPKPVELRPSSPALLCSTVEFETALLCLVLSESGRTMPVRLVHGRSGSSVEFDLPPGRASLLLLEKESGSLIDRYPRGG